MSDLINEYKQSVSEKNKAKLIIVLSSICIIALFSLIAISSAKSFAKNAVPEMSEKISNMVMKNSNRYLNEFTKSSSNVFPAYAKNIELSLKDEWPNIEKEITKEMSDLNSFAQGKYPQIKKELFEISMQQEEVLEKELNKILSKEQSEEIVKSYSTAALGAYQSFFKANFSEQQKQAKKISSTFERVIQSEPDVSDDASLHEAIGLSMKIIGQELISLGK